MLIDGVPATFDDDVFGSGNAHPHERHVNIDPEWAKQIMDTTFSVPILGSNATNTSTTTAFEALAENARI